MPFIKGTIYDINQITDSVVQIVMRGRDKGKTVLRCYTAIGFWCDKVVKEFKLKPKDKITAQYSIISTYYKERKRYFTDVHISDIKVTHKAPVKHKYLIDEETGEIIE
jgi:hypothetical protein